MEAPFQIVGCVLSSKPAAELIDAFVTHLRRERAAVMTRSAQNATFVRFNALDARLVTMACRAVRGQAPPLLRFGFAASGKEATAAGQEGLDVSTRIIVQANDLAAGAGDGEVLVSPQLAVRVLTAMKTRNNAQAIDDALPSLTKREEQILDAVSQGKTNKEVANTLEISEKTVKHYMTNIMHKLQVRNRVEAALMVKRKSGN